MPKQRKLSTKPSRSNRSNSVYRQAKSVLESNGVTDKIETTSEGKGSDKFLFALGVIVESVDERDYSLKSIASDKEYVLNPNILESKDYDAMKSEYDKPDDKFPNQNDPFYELDEAPTNSFEKKALVNRVKGGYTLSPIVGDILNRNLVKPRLKQMRSDK